MIGTYFRVHDQIFRGRFADIENDVEMKLFVNVPKKFGLVTLALPISSPIPML